MKNKPLAALMLLILFASTLPFTAAGTVQPFIFSGDELKTANFDAWGGVNGTIYTALPFNVDAAGIGNVGLRLTVYGLNMSRIFYEGGWVWPPDPTDLGAIVDVGITGTTFLQFDMANAAWFQLHSSCGSGGGTWNDQTGKYNHSYGNVRKWLVQGWHRGTTGGKVFPDDPTHQYNLERFVPNDPMWGDTYMPGYTLPYDEYQTFDFKIEYIPLGNGEYKMQGWIRMHAAASWDEMWYLNWPYKWQWNKAINNVANPEDAWIKIGGHQPDGGERIITGCDFSAVYPFITIANWGTTQTQHHYVSWKKVVVEGIPATSPPEIWVDDNWAGLPPGYEVEPGKFIGYNAFAKIQDGVNAVAEGGTVHVYDGTYDEQVVVGKSLVIQGYGDSTIVKPSSADKLTTVLSGYWWGTIKQIAGIVVANAAGGSVTLENIFIDGENIITKPSTADYVAGIFYRETGGTIDSVTVDDLTIGATGTAVRGYGVYISAIVHTVSVEVKDSTLTNFDKNGIDAHGDKLSVVIYGNTIIGRGPLPSGDEVQNGVVVMDGATGTINSNTISNMAYISETWWSAGILFMDSSGSASGNVITDCQIGIMFQDSGGLAQGNTVNGGAIGLIGIWAQYTKGGTWTLTFKGNTVSGAHDIEGYENAALGIQSWNEDASITATIESNQIAGDGSTSADGIFIGDIPEYEPAGTIKTAIKGNIISGWQCGVRFVSSIEFGSIATCNTITENNVGIQVEQAVNAANVVVNYNNIYGNTQYGVNATGPTVLDARYNWWGHETGPYHGTSWIYMGEPYGPHYGLGDNVSDYVLYDPWLEYPTPLLEPTMSVEPSSYRAKLRDEIFSVNITISNLSVGWKAVAFQFRLCYNSTLLEVLNVTEGPFLKDPKWNLHGTWFIYFTEVDPIHGSNIIVGLFLLPNATGQWTEFPSGSGTLATITFKAIYQHRGIEKPPLSCDLRLKSTIIEDADAILVAHNLEHGLYEILPTNIGDVNYDGIVDVRDLSVIGRAFGSTPSHPRWNPEADVNLDGVIDIRDISKAARNFGWVQDQDP